MNVIKVYACSFKSSRTLEEIRATFRELSSWDWLDRDNDRWGEYISARALPDPDWGMVKLFVDDGTFVVDLLLKSDSPPAVAIPACDAVEKKIFDVLLPAIGARDLTRVDSFE